MTDLQQVRAELAEIKAMLSDLLKQNMPFSVSAHEKGQIVAKALEESQRTGNKKVLQEAIRKVNGCRT